ncbi:hypothetical protein [Nannocystis punicea]|uniref:Uncharacterized protein n=1 Tax=Nannocystis punicea TaxID=2995304 RepID=A0ABY7GYC0_9BACT|nr:hypothetical protein [Nannocystis poenicansa]WAS91907.1 hypothetical protein O0S08_37470 [Nannocystis poenicansa]
MPRATLPDAISSPVQDSLEERGERQPKLSRQELERLGREGQVLRQAMQKQVEEFRKDPGRNRSRWL